MPWWRWRGGRGRPRRPVWLNYVPTVRVFAPRPPLNPEPVILLPPELEAMRLVDLEGKTQEEAAKEMKVSRGTVWRLLESGRKKVLTALVEGRPLVIEESGTGGET